MRNEFETICVMSRLGFNGYSDIIPYNLAGSRSAKKQYSFAIMSKLQKPSSLLVVSNIRRNAKPQQHTPPPLLTHTPLYSFLFYPTLSHLQQLLSDKRKVNHSIRIRILLCGRARCNVQKQLKYNYGFFQLPPLFPGVQILDHYDLVHVASIYKHTLGIDTWIHTWHRYMDVHLPSKHKHAPMID